MVINLAYEIDEIRFSQQIFYYLLEHSQLQEEDQVALYKAYTEQEEVQNLVKSQADAANCTIERYGDVAVHIGRVRRSEEGIQRHTSRRRAGQRIVI